MSSEEPIKIKIKNADPWAAIWITYKAYSLIDRGKLREIHIENVARAENSVSFTILIMHIAEKVGEKVFDKAFDKMIDEPVEELINTIRRWMCKEHQENLRAFIDNVPIKPDKENINGKKR